MLIKTQRKEGAEDQQARHAEPQVSAIDAGHAEIRAPLCRQRTKATRFHRQRHSLSFAHGGYQQWNRVADDFANRPEWSAAADATAHLVGGAYGVEFHLQERNKAVRGEHAVGDARRQVALVDERSNKLRPGRS